MASTVSTVIGPPEMIEYTTQPVIGLIAAILLVLLALALLLALFLARFCCCCARRKKEVYQVTPTPTYKTVEPIYVVTPPTGEGYPMPAHSDALYSSPYSNSPQPLPFPPPPGSNGASNRLRPYQASLHSAATGTPESRRQARPTRMPSNAVRRGERVPSAAGQNDDYAAVALDYATMQREVPYQMRPPMPHPLAVVPLPQLPSPRSNRSDSSSALLTPSARGESDLTFLDPRRKMETQTREELIY